jgi:hypothetical protein
MGVYLRALLLKIPLFSIKSPRGIWGGPRKRPEEKLICALRQILSQFTLISHLSVLSWIVRSKEHVL